MWKVRRTEDEDGVVLSLSGRLQRENLNELRRVFASEAAGHSLILDLKDLRLVDDAVVAFLRIAKQAAQVCGLVLPIFGNGSASSRQPQNLYRSESPHILLLPASPL